jgi:hypothetical protein
VRTYGPGKCSIFEPIETPVATLFQWFWQVLAILFFANALVVLAEHALAHAKLLGASIL